MKKSVLWQWAISYLLLLLIPLISIFINYNTNAKTIEEEYKNAYQLIHSNAQNGIENLIQSEKEFFRYILNNEVFSLLRKFNQKDGNYYYNAYFFQVALKNYCLTKGSIDCAIYHSAVDQIYASEGSNEIIQYYKVLKSQNCNLPDFDEWNAFISAEYNESLFISDYLSNDEAPALIYAHTLGQYDTKRINIFIMISVDEIEMITQNLPDKVYLILQMDTQVYAFDNSGLLHTQQIATLDDRNNLALKEDFYQISSPSDENDINYHLAVSNTAIKQDLARTKSTFILNLSITLFLGFLVILFALKRNYQPLSRLLSKITDDTPHRNEFQRIETVFEQLQKNYHSARMTVQHQNQALLNSWLLSLIKGRINDLEIQKQKKNFTINMDARVALIGITIPLADQQNMEYDELLFFTVNNIFEELFEGLTFYHIEDGRFIYYLFDLNETTPNTKISAETSWSDYALEKVEYLCDFINTHWNTTILGAVSETAENVSHCKFLYRKVMEAFEFQTVTGGNAAIDTRTLHNIEYSNYIRESIEMELDQAIKAGDLCAALVASEKIFSPRNTTNFAAQKIYAFDAFTIIMNIFNNYTINSAQQANALSYINILMQASSTTELRTCFNEILKYVCKEISQKWQSEENTIVAKIRQYVAENYTNQNLSVSSLANDLKYNPKYITRVFKEATSEGILDYINNYRISKAMEIMTAHDCTLKEIAEMVGYSNVRAFRRAFVKIKGDIPSKFNN